MSQWSKHKMKKSERYGHIRRRARELAATGDFLDYVMIEHAIEREGFLEARDVLDDRHVRDDLERIIKASQKKAT